MEDVKISFETAKLSNEVGLVFEDIELITQSVLQKRLRDVYKIYVDVQLDRTTYPKFAVEIYKYKSSSGQFVEVKQADWYLYRTYEEALEAGLEEALKSISK